MDEKDNTMETIVNKNLCESVAKKYLLKSAVKLLLVEVF